ncbi:hypothetical protein VOLCADRAFT_103274 [Volvox carteri f. nagariensis]|uniref:CBM20 domain-containing protein n=1 Tax=Volvox carteri f. nagariensis TaxID=3068 RepID=D8TKX7_VOLCA|nr:uncharacterized protein VOLCADRAFT_103274 [Volvox carteri f. nagariensis]EFJ51639.1 hypothetical protein VOLCADRAFT_103274 [Volvox carteri f. nagariensis]|eukprot:XP_002947049.1 hypothetical protein VOLCADRAFT_103274 [Volvox carteri f. nagariensis]
MKALTGVTGRAGEGVTSLSRGRSHREFFMIYRRGGQGAARSGAPQELTASTVTIKVPYRVNYGEVLRVVGSGKVLGDWSADRGLQLIWTEGDVWTVQVPISAGHYEFKCVVYNQATKSVARWEDGGNRILDITRELGTWDVSCQWGATAGMTSTFIPKPQPPLPAASELEPTATEATTSGDGVAAAEEELSTLMALSETGIDANKVDDVALQVEAVPQVASVDAPARSSGDAADTAVAGTSSSSSTGGGGSAALLLFATVAAAGAVAAVAFLGPSGLDKSILGARAGVAVSTTLQQSSLAGEQVRAQLQSQLATLAGHVSAVQPTVQAQMDNGDAEEAGDVIRPVTAGTDVLEDGGVGDEYGDASRPVTAGESNFAEGDEGAAGGDAEPDAEDRPPSARPGSARPQSARPDSAKPEAARPPSARPPSASPDAARPPSARPSSARPFSARPASASATPPADGQYAAQAEGAEVEAEGGDGPKPTDDTGADATTPEAEEDKGAGAGEGSGEEPQGSNHSHHPDVITDINQSPEARAEVDEIAQQQAKEVCMSKADQGLSDNVFLQAKVIRSRQSSACSVRKAGEEEKRRSSASNTSVRSGPPSRQGPAESLANMAMQPPSPSKIKTGPWLTGTYRLPKSGKIITGEELCDALERMTNAYIDKYTREKGPSLTKEIAPGAATVFNTKRLSQDEYDTMIARLYKPKDRNVADGDRIQLITLRFGDDGQEQWVPVKTVSAEEQQAYMCELYQRCLDNRKKTKEDLAAKYLKPLGPPRKK